MRRALLATSVVAGAWFFGHFAMATPITAASDFVVDFTGTNGSVTGTASAEFGAFQFNGTNSLTFKMIVANTTLSPLDVRFTSFGWVTAPPTTAVTDTTTVFASTANVSLGPNSLSVCFYSGPNCNGGSLGGLEDIANAGLHGDPVSTGIFSVTATFTNVVPPLDFSSFLGKFQTEVGSFDATGVVQPGCPGCVINPVDVVPTPEPISLAILGVGLLGLAVARRRV